MRVVVLMPVVGQPRYAKRIAMLEGHGVQVRLFAFDRDYHKGRMPQKEIEYLGRLQHGRYVSRIPVFIKSIKRLRDAAKKAEVVYAFGLDMGVLGFLATRYTSAKYVVEIGDVREVQTKKGVGGWLFRCLDNLISKFSGFMVFTAPAFYYEYYRKWLKSSVDGLVIENKQEKGVVPALTNIARFESDKVISIGYFGLLRCVWSAQVLIEIARLCPGAVRIHVAGYNSLPDDVYAALKSVDNIFVEGAYKSPDDLGRLYSSVDIVWACYAPIKADDWNLRWAKTNRFYESLYFGKPLITRQGSCDGEFVADNGVGLVVDKISVSEAANYICESLSSESVMFWASRARELPSAVYLYEDESAVLYKKIISIIR